MPVFLRLICADFWLNGWITRMFSCVFHHIIRCLQYSHPDHSDWMLATEADSCQSHLSPLADCASPLLRVQAPWCSLSSFFPHMRFSKCLSCPNPQFHSLSNIWILLKVVWQRWRWLNIEPCLSSVIRSFLGIHGKPGCLLTSSPFHPLCLKVSPAPFHLFLWVAPPIHAAPRSLLLATLDPRFLLQSNSPLPQLCNSRHLMHTSNMRVGARRQSVLTQQNSNLVWSLVS